MLFLIILIAVWYKALFRTQIFAGCRGRAYPRLPVRHLAGRTPDKGGRAGLPSLGWATARVAPTIYDMAFPIVIGHHIISSKDP
jgi:hypothetical protein